MVVLSEKEKLRLKVKNKQMVLVSRFMMPKLIAISKLSQSLPLSFVGCSDKVYSPIASHWEVFSKHSKWMILSP
ncbi:hypothetical protein P3S68_018600 [Capsicum galapagoense]